MASNRNILKKYAPQARLDFIQAMTNRAAQFGITKAGSAAGEVQGDLFILNGKAFPRSVANQRARLIARIARDGFAQVMEAVAYTWFNRFLAIRYMELHHYFDHGCRVLSHSAGHDEPELLENAASINLPGLNRDEIVNLKLEGTKDEQIYRRLLIAQCNDLHRAMPFLFEKIDDETELLLPENLLQSDSIVRKLVNEIDEAEWQEIEIIGWLYQFYISEKKDQVIGKVVKSEDIPAATQLFTPNWIVKYMVQNSLGAQWLATYPDSGIRSGMEYYIAPAEQTPEVQAQIDAITPKQLDPEAITLIDPAVGSGHILVEAYDLFRAIYLERGYTKREAARAILTKNLFGLDIDDRAAQMAGFALLMKACADDRSVLSNPPALNVLALQDSEGLDAEKLAKALLLQERFEMVPSGDLLPETLSQPTLSAQQPTSKEAKAIKALVTLFNGAKTFGSLITVPDAVMQSLPLLDTLLAKPLTGDLLLRQAQEDAQGTLKPLVEQARLLGGRYDCAVANPPYMGAKAMPIALKKWSEPNFRNSTSDLFCMFIDRCSSLVSASGSVAMVTMDSWMFSPAYEDFRVDFLKSKTIETMLHLGSRAFDSISGEIVCTTSFSFNPGYNLSGHKPTFVDLRQGKNEQSKKSAFSSKNLYHTKFDQSDFNVIEGSPVAYWITSEFLERLGHSEKLKNLARPRSGLTTSDNDRYLRYWWEVNYFNYSIDDIKYESSIDDKWIPINGGSDFRKWYGSNYQVILWENNGISIRSNPAATMANPEFQFKPGLTWSKISGSNLSVRITDSGFIFTAVGLKAFPQAGKERVICGLLNSKIVKYLTPIFSSNITILSGDIAKYPVADFSTKEINENVSHLHMIAKEDWDCSEFSWDFKSSPFLAENFLQSTLELTLQKLRKHWDSMSERMKDLETSNNTIFIRNYGLEGEIFPEVGLTEITLTCNPHYRYGSNLTDEDRETRLKSDTMCELVSYAIGCMMGRYSLAERGLIYTNSSGAGFDPSRYGAFPADDDGIIPLTEEQWFADDAAARIEEFLGIAWPDAPVMETLTTLMDGLSMGNAGEPRAALRSYLSKQFYKDHLQTYKNRPIYWLFSSGKHRAFEALVYLHRYNEGTLARMRTNHVTPLMGKLQQRISDLDAEIATSSSSAEKTRKSRDKEKIAKQLIELRAFDEELRHLADQRIALDLDDGVKANYARFGNLLAFKDKVCPKKKGEDE
ncbi:MAG: BREX-1 system adenine-specific DNA-methyltransferase PglX [Alphaproteobacteria bacterium]|nr:MAG: BREX-1 system adenine-specific DNA-methyltransferase PglX [Alphaproteobacteria bacterium]